MRLSTALYITLVLQITISVALASIFILDAGFTGAALIIIPSILLLLIGFIATYKNSSMILIVYMGASIILIVIDILLICLCANLDSGLIKGNAAAVIGESLAKYYQTSAVFSKGGVGGVRPVQPVMFNIVAGVGALNVWMQATGFVVAMLLRRNGDSSKNVDRFDTDLNPYVSSSGGAMRSGQSGYVHQQREPYIPPESRGAPSNPRLNKKSKYNANEPTLVSKSGKGQGGGDSYMSGYYQGSPTVVEAPAAAPTTFEAIYTNYIKPLMPAAAKEPQKVVKRHLPTLDDEVYLEIGDMVRVEEVFDDGWAVGLNVDTEKSGAFPIGCLEEGVKKSTRHEIVFSRAKGIYVWDVEDKKYMDFLSAYSAVNQGHSHPRIIAALVDQSSRLCLSSRAFHNDRLAPFAKKLTTLFKYDMMLPMNTGAEAVETAMKLARKWGYEKKGIEQDKAIVVGCIGNFHGRTLAICGMSNDESSRGGFGPFVERIGCVCPVSGRSVAFGSIEDLTACFEKHGSQIAGFLVEPIQGEAGIILPPDGYLLACQNLCNEHNVLFMIDEIQTGLGRTGKMLAHYYDGTRGDVLILGKALSGGVYPVSAVLADKDVMLCIKPVGLAALDVLVDEGMCENAERMGEVFRVGVRAIGSLVVKEVRGRGLLNAVVIDEAQCKANMGAWELCVKISELGLLAKPTQGNVVRFAPPLCISEQEVLDGVDIISRALAYVSL